MINLGNIFRCSVASGSLTENRASFAESEWSCLRSHLALILTILIIGSILPVQCVDAYTTSAFDYSVDDKKIVPTYPAAFSPDGRYLALFSPRMPKYASVLDLLNGETRKMNLPGFQSIHSKPSISFSSQGQVLVRGEGESLATLFKTDTANELAVVPAEGRAVLSPRGDCYLDISYDGISKYAMNGSRIFHPFNTAESQISAVSAGGEYVAYTSTVTTLEIQPIHVIPLTLLQTLDWSVTSLSVPSDASNIAVSLSGCVALATERTVIVAAGTAAARTVCRLPTQTRVRNLSFSADGQHLLVETQHILEVYDVKSGRREVAIKNGKDVGAGILSPDASFLLLAMNDGSINVVEVSTGKTMARYFQFDDDTWAIIDSEGRYDATDGGDIPSITLKTPQGTKAISSQKAKLHEPGFLGKLMGLNKAPMLEAAASGDESHKPRLVVQAGHSGRVTAVASEVHGLYVASGDEHGKVIVWEEESGRIIRQLDAHGAAVRGVVLLDSTSMITGGEDGNLKYWDLHSGECTRVVRIMSYDSPDRIKRLSLSADGRWLGVLTDSLQVLVYSTVDATVAGMAMARESATDMIFMKNSREILFSSYNGSLWKWDFFSGQPAVLFHEMGRKVYSLARSRDGKFILAGGDKNILRVLDGASGTVLRDIAVKITEYDHNITGIVFTGDGTEAAIIKEGETIVTLDVVSGKLLREFGAPFRAIEALAITHDGRIISAEHDGFLNIWLSATEKRTFGNESRIPRSMALIANKNGDGMVLMTSSNQFQLSQFTGDSPSILEAWDLLSGMQATVANPGGGFVYPLAVADRGTSVLAVVEQSERQSFMQVQKSVLQFYNSDGTVRKSVAASAGTHLGSVTCSEQGRFCLVGRTESNKNETGLVLDILDTATAEYVGTIVTPARGKFAYQLPTDLRLNRDGSLAFGSFTTETIVWAIPSGREVLKRPYERGLALTDDGKELLATESELKIVGREKWLYVVDIASGSVKKTMPLPFGKPRTYGEICNHCDRTLNQFDGFTYLDEQHAFKLGERRIEVWNMKSRKLLASLLSFGDGSWAVVAPDGRFDTNNLEGVKGLHWIMPDDPLTPLPLELFMRDYYEPRLLPRLLAGVKFPNVRDLRSLNRLQPRVAVTAVTREGKNDSIAVTVEVAAASRTFPRNWKPVTLSTGVHDLKLFRDGQLVGFKEKAIRLDKKTGRAVITFAGIRLPRKAGLKQVEFSAYAFNDDGVKSATSRLKYDLPADLAPAKGKAYLVNIGINRYQNRDWNLQYAVADAEKLRQTLAERIPQLGNYTDLVAITLTDEHATKGAISAVFDLLAGKTVATELLKTIPNGALLTRATPEDLLIISFSGHGYVDDNGTFYTFSHDTGEGQSKRITPELLKRIVSSEELTRWLRDVDAGDMAMIVDACHSAATVGEGFKAGPMGSRGLGQLAYDKGMRILAASQADDVALESDKLQQGLLTYALVHDGLEAFQADFKPKDTSITLAEWLAYAVERVPKLAEEVKQDRISVFGRGEASRAAVVSFGDPRQNSLTRKSLFQTPSLFDFTRRKWDVVVTQQ